MSTAIARNFQIGIDPTPTNNFTLYQPATPDGTLRLGNGNTGITSSLLTLTSAGNLGIGTSTIGSTGVSLPATYNLGWVQSAGESVPNIFRQTSSAATVVANGYRQSATANGFASSFSSSFAKSAIALNDGSLRFYTDTAAAVAAGTDVTPTERMRIDSAGNVGIGTSSPATRLDVNGTATTTALTVNGNNISAVNSLGFRNRIINGDMRIDQRNAGASVTSGYPVDRWRPDTTAQSSFSYQQNAGSVTPPTGFVNYLGCTSTAAYSPGSNTTVRIAQTVEGFNVADLAWGTANAQTVTLSFWVRSSLTGTHSGSAVNSSGTRSYVYSFTISSANTWEYKTIVIPGDTTGTWLTNNGIGLIIGFNLGTGTGTYGTTTAGTWQSGNLVGLTNAVQVSATNGATFYITGVQLEAGSVATPFERRDYGRELIMCQRYFQFWKSGWSGVSGGFGYQYSDGVNFCVPTRVAPTLALTSWTTGARFPQASWFTANVGVEGFLSVATANAAGGNDNWLATGTASAEL